jgi:hypothetical protein
MVASAMPAQYLNNTYYALTKHSMSTIPQQRIQHAQPKQKHKEGKGRDDRKERKDAGSVCSVRQNHEEEM